MTDHPIDRLSDWLDGHVTSEEHDLIEAHVTRCEDCAALVADLRAIRHSARSTPPPRAGADVWPDILRSIRAARLVHPTASRGRHRIARLPWRSVLAASAALALLGGGIGMGVGAAGIAAGAAASGGLDARAVAGILAVLVILVPAAAIAARIALKPFVDAYVRLRRDPSTEDELGLLARRIDTLEREIDNATEERRRLRESLEGADFMRRLQGGDTPDEGR